jgi:hypothetical protein
MFGSDFFEEVVSSKKNNKPSNLEMVYYLFWDKGISLTEFNELPLPYIFGILKTFTYIKEEEKKEMDKAKRKK